MKDRAPKPTIAEKVSAETPTKQSFLSRLQRVVSPKSKVSPGKIQNGTPSKDKNMSPAKVQNVTPEKKIDYFDRRLSSAFRSLKLTSNKVKEQSSKPAVDKLKAPEVISGFNRDATRRSSLQPGTTIFHSATPNKIEIKSTVGNNRIWIKNRPQPWTKMNNYIQNDCRPFCEVVQYKQLPSLNLNGRLVNVDANANMWY